LPSSPWLNILLVRKILNKKREAYEENKTPTPSQTKRRKKMNASDPPSPDTLHSF